MNKLLGNEVLVLQRPNSKNSLLNRQNSTREKIIQELKRAHQDNNTPKVLSILNQITAQLQNSEIFESNESGREDSTALTLFQELATQTNSPEVSKKAIEIIFAYAHEQAPVIITEPGSNKSHPNNTEIIKNLQGYLTETDPVYKRATLSELASALGYHITDLRQPVPNSSAPGSKTSRKNNLLMQLSRQRGIGKVIFNLLDRTSFLDDNKALMRTRFSNDASEVDRSMQGELQKANMFHVAKASIMKTFGSMSSCNFSFRIPKFDPKTGKQVYEDFKPVYELDYSLETLLEDVCQEGPKEANSKFIDAYVQFVSHKEMLREVEGNESAIKRIEKELAKALKFLFDPNKLQATGEEGELLYQSLSSEMKATGVIRFLNGLYQSMTGPNETAEVIKIAGLYNNAFSEELVYVANGTKNKVTNLQEYKLAQVQIEESIRQKTQQTASTILSGTNPIKRLGRWIKANCGGSSGVITIKTPNEFNQFKKDFNDLCSSYTQQAESISSNNTLDDTSKKAAQQKIIQDFKNKLSEDFGIVFSANSQEGSIETISSVSEFARNQIPNTFEEFGEDFERHVKSGGGINAISSMRNKSKNERDPAEDMILKILADDKIRVQRHNDDKSKSSTINFDISRGFLEDMLNTKVLGHPDVNSTLVASYELIRRINEEAKGSKATKRKATREVLTRILGLSAEDITKGGFNKKAVKKSTTEDLYGEYIKYSILSNQEESIKRRAFDRFTGEIVKFASATVPGIGLDALDSSSHLLDRIRNNLISIQGKSEYDPDRKRIDLENQRLLNLDLNSENSFGLDSRSHAGTVIDPNQNLDMLDLFIETIKQVYEYVKESLVAQNSSSYRYVSVRDAQNDKVKTSNPA